MTNEIVKKEEDKKDNVVESNTKPIMAEKRKSILKKSNTPPKRQSILVLNAEDLELAQKKVNTKKGMAKKFNLEINLEAEKVKSQAV